MIKSKEQFELWFKERTLRERALFLVSGLLVIYTLWYLFLMHPLISAQKEAEKKWIDLQNQTANYKKQADLILDIANKNSYLQKLKEKKQIQGEATGLEERLQGVKAIVVPMEKLSDITKDVLNQQQGIQLISLKKLDISPWAPPGIENIEALSKYASIYKQSFEITFHSSYFDTLRYLTDLEKLPWRLYWDSLEYNVTDYPDAQVTIRFYVLVNQKS